MGNCGRSVTTLRHIVLMILVALFAANPVMACCLSGHSQVTEVSAVEDTPPCHEIARSAPHSGVSGADVETQSETLCPGCTGCYSAILTASTAEDGIYLQKIDDTGMILPRQAHLVPASHAVLLRKTGPPGQRVVLAQTPVRLKQRLLI